MKYGYNCATPPPRMSAPSSICSDDSFEKLDPEELQDDAQPMYKPKVTFHEVFDVYPMDADIVARVTFDDDYVKSDKDTAIVVPLAWKSVDQALCATKIDGNHVRFDVKELPKTGAEEIFYQLCYCTEDKIVMGVSIPFLFREVREDELIEFQKERNNEFWTFRSRFAVLMDIYWNFVVESKLERSTTDEVPTGELAEALNGDKKENSTESEVDRTSRVLLFQIMKHELEEMKKQYEEMKTQYEEEKNKNEELFSLIKSLFQSFSATERKNCIEMMKKLYDMYPKESFEYHASYMRMMIRVIKMAEDETIIEKQANDAEKKKIMLLLQLLRIVFTGCKFTSSINRDTCVNFLREWEHLFTEEKSDVDRLINMIRYDGDFAPKDIQSNEEAHQDVIRCNAHFVATSSHILLATECDKETPLKSAVVGEAVGNNVPDDWKAEKASLLEKCSKLEDEIKTKDETIQGLQEKLINQEQGEVEKVIAATDKVHETYAREMKKLVAANKSIGELLRAKEEERKLMMARVEIPIVSMEAEIEDKEKIIETLKEEIAQHEETYEIFINKLDSQMKEIKEANKKMAELNELLAKKDDTISNLERQLVNFNTHTCEASSARRVVELEERLQTVYTTLWDERREMIKLRDSLQILQAQLNSLRDKPKKAVWKRGDVLGNLALIKATRPFRLSERLPMLPDYSKSQASTSSQGEDKSKMVVSSKFTLFEKVVDEQTNPGSQSSEEMKQSAESPTTQARRKKLLQDLGEAMCQLNHQIVVLRRELKSEKLKVSELTKENEDLKQHAEEFKDLYSKSEVAESGVDKLREEMENLRKNARDLEEKMKIMAEEKAAEKHEYDVLKALHKKTVADLEAKLKDAQLNRSVEENAAYAKLVEEREVMLDLHSKEVLNLEARLKEGAKQYAKLYMKYEKLARSSQSSNLNSLT